LLTSKGITCVLLKYRVPCAKVGPYRNCPTALEDAQRTVGLVRFHAAQWHIDPRKIGVLGFSAGGHLVAAISTHFENRLYHAVDAADNVSCRPDFAVALYPGHLAVPEKGFALNPDIQVSSRTPPTFLVQAEDPVDPVASADAAALNALVEQPREQRRLAVVCSRTATAVHEDCYRDAPDWRVRVNGGAEVVSGAAATMMVVLPSP
jgi:acetyl esterase/lipase